MGHAATPRKLFQFNLRDTPFCDCDGIQMGNVNHTFLVCLRNAKAIDLFYIRSSRKIPFPTSIKLILTYFNHDCHESNIQELIIKLIIESELFIAF